MLMTRLSHSHTIRKQMNFVRVVSNATKIIVRPCNSRMIFENNSHHRILKPCWCKGVYIDSRTNIGVCEHRRKTIYNCRRLDRIVIKLGILEIISLANPNYRRIDTDFEKWSRRLLYIEI